MEKKTATKQNNKIKTERKLGTNINKNTDWKEKQKNKFKNI